MRPVKFTFFLVTSPVIEWRTSAILPKQAIEIRQVVEAGTVADLVDIVVGVEQ